MLDGSRRLLVSRVGDGSIICRFEGTPSPKGAKDIVCPHFLELKWAFGCPFKCAWCYLQGTLRLYPSKKQPKIKYTFDYGGEVELYGTIERHLKTLFMAKGPDAKEMLNTGELADSLMTERSPMPFSKFIIPLFETQDRYKVLFLTKSYYIENLLEIEPHRQAVISFSLNAEPVAAKWEKAPKVAKRIEAAKAVFDARYETRIRIDPIVPYPEDEWVKHYQRLIDEVFSKFTPERITLGSLRGLQSTINAAEDKSWVVYLGERTEWGRRIPFQRRLEMFGTLIDYLKKRYDYTNVALCKEPVAMWEALGLDWRHCRCNCVL
jgi:spore photoproduct lyase